ncbi:MAG: hypothetical protein U5K72_12110 [Balneolaceae bacterium]|nr:hypothetical protein [Balneolaceae bacterium]
MKTHINKQELIDWIANLNDPESLVNVQILKESLESNGDWWNEISETEKSGINRGLDDVKTGRVISNEAFWKKHEHRL